MKSTLKTWTGLGLATALAGAGLAGCAGEGGETGEGQDNGSSAIAGEAGEGGEAGESGEGGEGGEGGESGTAIGALPLEKRLAFMAGHVEAGLALYRAGQPEAAAPHLLHPVSETHEDERAGLERVGFDPAPYRAVSDALEQGRSASEVRPLIAAAQANLASMRERAGGDPAEIIRFLLDTARGEYSAAVVDGKVVDPREYQDAWGFVRVARQVAERLDTPNADEVRDQLDALIALWPDPAPVPPASPAPAGQVSALASRVELALGRQGR